MFKGKQWFLASVLLVLVLIFTMGVKQVESQEKYPTKPIDIIAPVGAGGGGDMFTRLGAGFLSKKWGVPVNVINKPGGNMVPATLEVYSAAPNGYTVIYNDQSISTLGIVMKDLPFKVMDRTFLSMVGIGTIFFFVNSSSPYKSLEDVTKEAKRDPQSFTWTSLGGSSIQDIAGRQFLKAIGVDYFKTQPITAKSGAEGAGLVAGGHVKFGIGSVSAVRASVKANLNRLVAVTKMRSPEFPDVPTTTELGYPTMDTANRLGFSGPPKMPSYIVGIWENAMREAGKDREYVSQLTNLGLTFSCLDSRESGEFIMKEIERNNELFGVKK